MAKKSMIAREAKRAKQVLRYAEKRKTLKQIISSPASSVEAVDEAVIKLSKLPRDSSLVRKRNRCQISGRPHGVYRKFGLCRNKLRKAAMNGEVPGLVKASW